MSTLLELISKVKVNAWQFWRAVFSANHDYPYHDYTLIENDTQVDGDFPYVVGSSMVGAHGSQRKLFTAKRTLLWCSEFITFTLNNNNNTPIGMKVHGMTVDATIYQMELHTNISVIIFHLSAGQVIKAYFEGVLPEEARHPE